MTFSRFYGTEFIKVVLPRFLPGVRMADILKWNDMEPFSLSMCYRNDSVRTLSLSGNQLLQPPFVCSDWSCRPLLFRHPVPTRFIILSTKSTPFEIAEQKIIAPGKVCLFCLSCWAHKEVILFSPPSVSQFPFLNSNVKSIPGQMRRKGHSAFENNPSPDAVSK